MSMSVDERRTEVLSIFNGPWGKLRKAKASSRYDRRFRYYVVEWCPAKYVGTDLEEYSYKVLTDCPVSNSNADAETNTAFFACLYLLRSQNDMLTLASPTIAVSACGDEAC